MKMTSSEANKLLRKYEDEKAMLSRQEAKMTSFHCAVGEKIEDCKTEYVFSEMQKRIEAVDEKIIKLKHAINVFNTTTEVNGDLTIDQVLIRLPQLNTRKLVLDGMRKQLSKERYSINSGIIDYVYTAYDPAEANAEYEKVSKEISDLQLALDRINTTKTFDF